MKKPDIKAMTLREKIAQTLLVRQSDLMLRADRDYKEARGAQEAAEIMKKQQFGGLWMHGNVDVNGIDGSLDTSFHFTSQTYRKWLDGIKPSLTYPLLCANDAAGIYSYSDVSDYAMGMIVGAADGRLSEERIDDACRRVLALKERLGLFDETEDENMTMEEACAETAHVQQEIARRGVTLVRNTESFLPVAKEHIKHVTIIAYSHSDEFLPRLEAMKKSFEARGAKVDLRGKLENFTDIQNVAAKSDLIVYAALVSFHCPKGQPGFYDDVFWALRYAYTLGREKSVGVAFGYPYIDYDFMDDACTFVNAYMPSCEIQESFVAGVYGEQPFMGKPPYDVTRMGSIRH